MPLVSVVFITIRSQPHFDWLFHGLGKQTWKDFEVIVIDDRPSMDRYKECMVEARKNDVMLGYYGKSKPSRWTGKRPALCNARNTALTVAKGKYIIFHDDNGWSDPQWIGYHLNWGQFGLMCAGTWFTVLEGRLEGDKLLGDPGPYGWEQRKNIVQGAIPFPSPDWLHGGNMGFPLDAAIAVNGFDEMYDGEQGVDDCDFGIRARRAGYKGIFEPGCIVTYSLKSAFLTQNEVPEVKPDKAKITRDPAARKPKEKMLRDGRMHFSNELLIQNLLDDRKRVRANPNFDLAKLRDEYNKTLDIKHELGPERDWRDDQLISEME